MEEKATIKERPEMIQVVEIEEEGLKKEEKPGEEKSRKPILLIVVGIVVGISVLALLFLFIIPGVKKSQKESNLNLCYNNVKRLAMQLDNYKRNEGRYPSSIDKLVPHYFKGIPNCPEAAENTYSEGYRVSEDGQVFTLFCRGKFHTDMGIPPNFPFYSSDEGLVRKR